MYCRDRGATWWGDVRSTYLGSGTLWSRGLGWLSPSARSRLVQKRRALHRKRKPEACRQYNGGRDHIWDLAKSPLSFSCLHLPPGSVNTCFGQRQLRFSTRNPELFTIPAQRHGSNDAKSSRRQALQLKLRHSKKEARTGSMVA